MKHKKAKSKGKTLTATFSRYNGNVIYVRAKGATESVSYLIPKRHAKAFEAFYRTIGREHRGLRLRVTLPGKQSALPWMQALEYRTPSRRYTAIF